MCGQKALLSSSFQSENTRICRYCFHTFSVSFQNSIVSSPLLVMATETNPKCTSYFLTLGFSCSTVCGIHHFVLWKHNPDPHNQDVDQRNLVVLSPDPGAGDNEKWTLDLLFPTADSSGTHVIGFLIKVLKSVLNLIRHFLNWLFFFFHSLLFPLTCIPFPSDWSWGKVLAWKPLSQTLLWSRTKNKTLTLPEPKKESESEVAQSCPTLWDPMNYSLPGSSIHGIFQARVLEWVVISFSRGSSRPRDRTQVSHIVGRCFTIWATREAQNTRLPCKSRINEG